MPAPMSQLDSVGVGPLTREPRVEVRRGSYIESVHAAAACAVRANGEVLQSFGYIDIPYPIRSLAKPFIAEQLVRCGAADAFDFSDAEIALACGSHDGQEHHIETIRKLLARLGLDEEGLLCGPSRVGSAILGPPVEHNCSGKHAAVLAMCKHLSLPIEGYLDEKHPIHQILLPALMRSFGREPHNTAVVVDGCGMPIFGASLLEIATAYARFGSASTPATSRVRAAMITRSEYVGGWRDNLDTRIISLSHGLIVGKIGAEGLHADMIVDRGIGIAVKIIDGNSRAIPPILARLFAELADDAVPQHLLAELAAQPVLNAAGHRVGDIRCRWNTDAELASLG